MAIRSLFLSTPARSLPLLALLGSMVTLFGCGGGGAEAQDPPDTGLGVEQVDSGTPSGSMPEASPSPGDENSVTPVDVGDASSTGTMSDTGQPPARDTGTAPPADDAAGPQDSGTTPPTGDGGGFQPCPAQGTPCAIMPLGDSITYGYGSTDSSGNESAGYRIELFAKAVAANKSITFVGTGRSPGPTTVSGKPFSTANEGHSGYTIDTESKGNGGISPLVDHAISSTKPNIILLMAGTNDMHYSIDLPNAPVRLGKLIDQIIADAPSALLVVAQIVSANGAQNAPTITYNAAIPGVVKTRASAGKHVVLVDMYTALGSWSGTNFKDSEHPNNAGYALMAATWYPAIQNYLR